jgi:hypothetical protein
VAGCQANFLHFSYISAWDLRQRLCGLAEGFVLQSGYGGLM